MVKPTQTIRQQSVDHFMGKIFLQAMFMFRKHHQRFSIYSDNSSWFKFGN